MMQNKAKRRWRERERDFRGVSDRKHKNGARVCSSHRCRLQLQPPLMDDETPVGSQWRAGVKELEPISSSLQSHKLKQERED